MAGKVMALKAFGNYSPEELSNLKAKNKAENLTIADIREMWNLWKLGNLVKAEKSESVVDHIQYAHSVTEDIYEKYFVTNTNETDVIVTQEESLSILSSIAELNDKDPICIFRHTAMMKVCLWGSLKHYDESIDNLNLVMKVSRSGRVITVLSIVLLKKLSRRLLKYLHKVRL